VHQKQEEAVQDDPHPKARPALSEAAVDTAATERVKDAAVADTRGQTQTNPEKGENPKNFACWSTQLGRIY
jgi:hypothetical protein